VVGTDVTPASEPQPYLSVDRLVLVQLHAGVVGAVRVVMAGACTGTMADIVNLQTCVDTDATLVDVSPTPLDPDRTPPSSSAQGAFGAPVACPASAAPRPGRTLPDGTRLFDAEACADGGTFVFGNDTDFDQGQVAATPERLAIVGPFLVDRYEVTVARWRDALARGFKSPDAYPTTGRGALEHDTCAQFAASDQRWCTWTALPGALEEYPLDCVSWAAARAFCRFEGGDLPTEAQWEYVAQVYGRSAKTANPWGDAAATCLFYGDGKSENAVFARLWVCGGANNGRESCLLGNGGPSCDGGTDTGNNCGKQSVLNPRQGPQPEDAVDHDGGDRSAGLGIVNLGGSMGEHTRDALYGLDSNCWAAAPLVEPVCDDPHASAHTVRGGTWVGGEHEVPSALRHTLDTSTFAEDYVTQAVGFRCVRPVGSP
jgi:formylglycine-generating enzyme required for sulfatase activity